MSGLDQLFQQFLRERLYLKNVTPKTTVWYHTAWKTYLQSCPEPPITITRADLQRFIIHAHGETGVWWGGCCRDAGQCVEGPGGLERASVGGAVVGHAAAGLPRPGAPEP